LILLQRTMVVVEGVARGLDPNINIWQVARPVVEDYVKKNVGPAALLRDMTQAARIIARFGPRLPKLIEDALIAAADPPKAAPKPLIPSYIKWAAGLFGAVGFGFWLGHII
jgi:ubiquinone biosynthesis protein